ncbi:hypothetical protein BDY21DRAFT_257695, partial [Lineolata rhizophorae]
MFSCVNYERGCRGRSNTINGRCDSCVALGLSTRQSPAASSSASSLSSTPTAYSAMTSSFASLSQLQRSSP